MKEQFANFSLLINEETLYRKQLELRKSIEEWSIVEKRISTYLNVFSYQNHLPHIQRKQIPTMQNYMHLPKSFT